MTTTPALHNLPDQTTIDSLARNIAVDGTHAHHRALGLVADAAEQAAMLPGSVAVLRDRDAPDATRARAFLALARHWDEIVAPHSTDFDQAFRDLAEQWSAHQQLRREGNIGELACSAQRLDQLRLRMRSVALN